MNSIKQNIVGIIRTLANDDIVVAISTISTLYFAIHGIWKLYFFIKYPKEKKIAFINPSTLKIFSIVLAGFIAPLYLILLSYKWHGWQFWLIQGISFFTLLTFSGGLFIFYKMHRLYNNKN